ncbi:unnamed protein product [Rotaria magnacalcarata]|uniref:Suppressor of G2 allele of SKP1 n=4 Tax=Rotaria magnacalcarata TaxID=392030 RepID=A0A814Y3N0_9BILA|nr:unnamed protein product [Rotaria magnacalcarata]CAF1574193.1 unnamed protein product [Rotaria magnacalcarata]CAF2092570.1 unnamed protein product [Rotaria magnacalcarata]CAF2128851.1 unnamed protein product [Rotaria magnacalcarata]CAF2135747.1 unnamed protein product [Rotaria magnacalcarata]
MASNEQTQSETSEVKPVVNPPKKINHTWYQSETCVYVVIPIRNVQRDQVHVESTENTLSVNIKLPSSNSEYNLELDLAYHVNSSRTDTKVNTANVEVRLYKVDAIQWASLDSQHKPNAPPVIMNRAPTVQSVPPSYPSSSKKPKDWDKLEVEIKKEEKEEKLEGDAALNQLFQQIYRDGSDEQRRAMNKSFMESGGTVLSTNWDDIAKKKTECKPPDGMEWKPYDS